MDQATLQARIYRGYGLAAARLGSPCQHYRPATADAAIAAGNLIGTLQAAFDTAPTFAFRAPSAYANPKWFGLFDASAVRVADYLVGNAGTFFVASLEPIHPPLCIQTNRTLTFTRPGTDYPNPDYYGGDVTGMEDTLLTAWPASVLQGTKGEKGEVQLPGDTRLPWVQILVPAFPGVQFRMGDIATDDQEQPMRYTLSSAELTGLGWRLTASMAAT